MNAICALILLAAPDVSFRLKNETPDARILTPMRMSGKTVAKTGPKIVLKAGEKREIALLSGLVADGKTVSYRVRVDEAGGKLLGHFDLGPKSLTVAPQRGIDIRIVPREAILRIGSRKQRVILMPDAG